MMCEVVHTPIITLSKACFAQELPVQRLTLCPAAVLHNGASFTVCLEVRMLALESHCQHEILY